MSAPDDRPYVRRSARVLLRDGAGRVLLVRSRFRRAIDGVEFAWFAPGGGVQDGEVPEGAAVREVWEETGVELQPSDLVHLATSEGDGRVEPLAGLMRDDFYVARTDQTEITVENMEPGERAAFGEYRWWRVDELNSLQEPVFPRDLRLLLEEYDAASSWSNPRTLEW